MCIECCICIPPTCQVVHRRRKKISDALELPIQKVGSHHVRAGTQQVKPLLQEQSICVQIINIHIRSQVCQGAPIIPVQETQVSWRLPGHQIKHSVSSRFSKRSFLKKHGGGLRRHQSSTSDLYTCMCTPVHAHTHACHTHACPHTYSK